MDKSLARAKHEASRRGRRKFSQHRHHGAAAAAAGTPAEAELWDEYQDVLPLEDLDQVKQSRGPFDYAELLARDPFYELTDTSLSGGAAWDPLQDALQDLYYAQDSSSEMASLLSLDLDKLGESLATMSLATRLCLDDESLPSELLDDGRGTELEETELKDDRVRDLEEAQGTPQVQLDTPADTNTEDQTFEEKTVEGDLDDLLSMLNDVKIGHISAVHGFMEPGRDEEDEEEDERFITPVAHRDNVDEEPGARKTVQAPREGRSSAAADEDFDAWLDSLG